MLLDICLKYNLVETIYLLAHSLFVKGKNNSLTLHTKGNFLTESFAKFQQHIGKF